MKCNLKKKKKSIWVCDKTVGIYKSNMCLWKCDCTKKNLKKIFMPTKKISFEIDVMRFVFSTEV